MSAEIDVDTGSLSKTQFVAQASKICRARMNEVDRKFAAYLKGNPDIGSLSRAEQAEKAEEIVETIYLPEHDRRIDEVASLGAPSGDEEQVAAILEALEKGLAKAEEDPLKFVQALSPKYRPFAQAERLAAAYGVALCGRG